MIKDIDRAAGVVIHNGQILLMHRRNRGKEYFTFPGGGIEEGESIEQAVIRELEEETSLIVLPEKLLYTLTWDEKTKQHFYLCAYQSGVPRLSKDSVEREVMDKDPSQYYEPIWVDISILSKILLYPLEIRDWFIADLQTGFKGEVEHMALQLATCRQEL